MTEPQILQMFGLIYVAIGIGMFINSDFYKPLLKEYKSNPAMTTLTGMIAFVLGFVIIANHNVWEPETVTTVMITFIGWLALFKGLIILAFPTVMVKLIGGIAPLSHHTKAWALVIAVLGLVISFLGFLVA